jgi:hypothetical protein
LGLALDLKFIEDNQSFSKVYTNELNYMQGPVVDDLVIAPVDTTLAIYRKDLFVMNKFLTYTYDKKEGLTYTYDR